MALIPVDVPLKKLNPREEMRSAAFRRGAMFALLRGVAKRKEREERKPKAAG